MSPNSAIRVLLYSHDTFGLGHLSRTLRVARALQAQEPRVCALILSGSPVAGYLPLPPGADLVKLPSVIKTGGESYRSRDLNVDFARIKKMRIEVIRGTTLSFRPHLFLVDNVPLGMKQEVLPTLEMLRREMPQTRVVLNLRDILDDPQVIADAWRRDAVFGYLETLYDRICVLGDRTFFDATVAYGLPPDQTVHLGYAAPLPLPRTPVRPLRSRPRILLTAGGGGDGLEVLEVALEGLRSGIFGDGRLGRCRVEMVSGPLMEAASRQELARRAALCGIDFHEFVPDLPRRMAEADLVVAMAGYNTCCEILSHARSALLIPRVTPRVEQLLRARLLAQRGLVQVLEPRGLTPDAFRSAVRDALQNAPRIRPERLPAMNGLPNLAEALTSMLPQHRPGKRMARVWSRAVRPDEIRGGLTRAGTSVPAASPASCPSSRVPGPRSPRWNVPGAAAVTLLLLASRTQAADSAWGGTFSVGWDRNLLQSSRAEERAFRTADPDQWFEIESLDDWRAEFGLRTRWEVPSLYKKLRVEVEARRSEVAGNPILRSDAYAVSLRQKLPRSARIDLEVAYAPQIYMRHRRDKDALPGQPVFRPEAYSRLEAELGYTRPVLDVPVTFFGQVDTRRETRWFRERDRTSLGAGVKLDLGLGPALSLQPVFVYAEARSRNRPDLGSDFSHREPSVGMGLRSRPPFPFAPWKLDAGTEWKFRTYLTRDPEDSSRFDRKDLSWWWNVRLARPAGVLTPFVAVEASARRVDLPAGADASTEEGEYDSSWIYGGMEWEF